MSCDSLITLNKGDRGIFQTLLGLCGQVLVFNYVGLFLVKAIFTVLYCISFMLVIQCPFVNHWIDSKTIRLHLIFVQSM